MPADPAPAGILKRRSRRYRKDLRSPRNVWGAAEDVRPDILGIVRARIRRYLASASFRGHAYIPAVGRTRKIRRNAVTSDASGTLHFWREYTEMRRSRTVDDRVVELEAEEDDDDAQVTE